MLAVGDTDCLEPAAVCMCNFLANVKLDQAMSRRTTSEKTQPLSQ